MAFKHGGCFQVQDSENSSDARLQYIQGVVLNVYIHQALEDIKANKGDDTGEPSLIEMFYDRGCDDATAIVMALDMMFAGIDTSSHLTAFAMFQLARNPEVQERLYQEIKSELPSRDSKFDKKALEKMPYLKATVKETLRTNLPAAVMGRKLNSMDTSYLKMSAMYLLTM
jgi:cytochrome P450